jgi:hypothetical protein
MSTIPSNSSTSATAAPPPPAPAAGATDSGPLGFLKSNPFSGIGLMGALGGLLGGLFGIAPKQDTPVPSTPDSDPQHPSHEHKE